MSADTMNAGDVRKAVMYIARDTFKMPDRQAYYVGQAVPEKEAMRILDMPADKRCNALLDLAQEMQPKLLCK